MIKRARGITGSVGALEANYISGVMQGLDTTMDITTEQESGVRFSTLISLRPGQKLTFSLGV